MKIGIYYEKSTNVNGEAINKANVELVERLAKLSGHELVECPIEDVKKYDLVISFIGGGGTEGRFKKQIKKLPKPIFLIASGSANSLPASMEILSYLQQKNIPSEIIHGSDITMAKRIDTLARVFAAKKKLSNFRIGRVGKPSDWLISSDVDAEKSAKENGIEIVDVPMKEFLKEINKHTYEENEYTKAFMKKTYGVKKAKTNVFADEEKVKALEIYGALKRICTKYKLNGVTVRCFDLLTSVKGTGCVALSILNAEGIYASCEGDTPALISMAVLGELTGEPVFQANPSRVLPETNEIILAHCTLPMNMPKSMELMTHFESGIGVAFRGKIEEGPITIFKTDGMLSSYFVSDGILEKNLTETFLCRTQVRLELEKSVNYFLKESIGNHHLIIKGNHSELVDEFYKW